MMNAGIYFNTTLFELNHLGLEEFCKQYNVDYKQDGIYYNLKYNQYSVDWENHLAEVRACRGLIVKRIATEDSFKYVPCCAPFMKFFNYGEVYADDIYWDDDIKITLKIDGSLMKIWYDNEWHLSTNNTIDAFKAMTPNLLTFGEVFNTICKLKTGKDWKEIAETLDPSYTYLFEMTSPETIVVCHLPKNITFLGRRHIDNFKEDFINDTPFCSPQSFNVNNFEDCLALVKEFDAEHEGLVVCDKFYNRVKIKGEEYLKAAHLINNRVITLKRVLQMIIDGKEDDFLGYCPEYTKAIRYVKNIYTNFIKILNNCWMDISIQQPKTKKDLVYMLDKQEIIKSPLRRAFIFSKYDNPELTVEDFISNIRIDTIIENLNDMDDIKKKFKELVI